MGCVSSKLIQPLGSDQFGKLKPMGPNPLLADTKEDFSASIQRYSPSDWHHSRTFYNELERLDTTAKLGLLNTNVDPRFQTITALMASVFKVPVSLVSLLGESQCLFKTFCPPFPSSRERDITFCDAVMVPDTPEVLVVEDAWQDARFSQNPGVNTEPYIRFYAGAPLVGSDGFRYGTLCVVDFKPRRFKVGLYNTLMNFAELVVRDMERDRMFTMKQEPLEVAPQLLRSPEACHQAVALVDTFNEGWGLLYTNDAWTELTALLSSTSSETGSGFDESDGEEEESMNNATTMSRKTAACAVSPTKPSNLLSNNNNNNNLKGAVTKSLWDIFTPASEYDTSLVDQAVLVGCSVAIDVYQLDSSGDCLQSAVPLTLTLRPAAHDVLESGVAVGIPNFVGSMSGAGVSAEGGSVRSSSASSIISRVNTLWFAVLDPPPPGHHLFNPTVGDMEQSASSPGAGGVHQKHVMVQRSVNGRQSAPAAIASTAAAAMPVVEVAKENGSSQGTQDKKKDSSGDGGRKSSMNDAVEVVQLMQNAAADIALNRPPIQELQAKMLQALAPPAALNGIKLGVMVGSGSSARVYRAIYNRKLVAVKVINDQASAVLDRWRHTALEASLTLGQTHPNIIQTVTFIAACDQPPPPPPRVPSQQALAGFGNTNSTENGTNGTNGKVGSVDGSNHSRHSQGSNGDNNQTTTNNQTTVPGVLLRGNTTWIVQQYCDRGKLNDACQQGFFKVKRSPDGDPNMKYILRTAGEIAGAVAHMHSKGVLHGDLNGNNVLLTSSTQDGRNFKAMVGDFGLGLMLQSGGLGHLVSATSVAHMPPELLVQGLQSQAGDVYAFGVVLWEMYCGARAWLGRQPSHVAQLVASRRGELPIPSDTPDKFRLLLEDCLAYHPAARPSMEDVKKRIAAMLKLGR